MMAAAAAASSWTWQDVSRAGTVLSAGTRLPILDVVADWGVIVAQCRRGGLTHCAARPSCVVQCGVRIGSASPACCRVAAGDGRLQVVAFDGEHGSSWGAAPSGPVWRKFELSRRGMVRFGPECRKLVCRAMEETGEGGTAGTSRERTGWARVSGPVLGTLVAGTLLFGAASADATDALKTCTCLFKECRVELARCIADPKCAANVACLQTCNNRPDETECQIGCGDLFENKVVDEFNDCAVTRKGCVPQKADEGRFPIPAPDALVSDFNTSKFTGKWYITSGLNRTFDTFDCQLHEFTGGPKKIAGKLAWRIATPDGGFFTRSAQQNFVQDPKQPGLLFNHGNEFLHYEDDWYILSAKMDNDPDDYVFVYYRGKNDAWDGYGGAVVYTRSNTLPKSIVPELTRAAKTVGLDFNKFKETDNTCGPQIPLFDRLEKKAEQEEQFLVAEAEEEEMVLVKGLKQVAATVGQFLADIVKGDIDLFNRGAAELKRDEELFLKELGDEEKTLYNDLNMEARDIERLFGNPVPIRKRK